MTDGIPATGGELPRINLWRYPGGNPAFATHDEVDVVIRLLDFTPG